MPDEGHHEEEHRRPRATGEGYFAEHEEIDSSSSRGVYSFAEDRQEQVLDAMRNRRSHDADEVATRAMERRQAEELYGQRTRHAEELFIQQKRHTEEGHNQRMRVMEQNQAINNQLLMLVAAAMGFAALGTQNADQAQMNAQALGLAGILTKILSQTPPVTTATGDAGKAAG